MTNEKRIELIKHFAPLTEDYKVYKKDGLLLLSHSHGYSDILIDALGYEKDLTGTILYEHFLQKVIEAVNKEGRFEIDQYPVEIWITPTHVYGHQFYSLEEYTLTETKELALQWVKENS